MASAGRWRAGGRCATWFEPSTLVYSRNGSPPPPSAPGVRRGRRSDRRHRDLARASEAVRGFDGVRRRGGHPGHGDPAGGGDAQGSAAGAGRSRVIEPGGQAGLVEAGQAGRSIGMTRRRGSRWCRMLVNDALAVLAELTGPEAPQPRTRPRTHWACGVGRRPGRGAGRGLRWRRRALAHRAAGGPGSGDLDRGSEARHTRKSKSNRKDGFQGCQTPSRRPR